MSKNKRSFFEKLTGSIDLDNLEKNIMTASDTSPLDTWTKELGSGDGELAIDMYQTPTHVIVQTVVGGIPQEDIDVSVMEDMVLIKGKRERHKEVSREDLFLKELYWGTFSRSILLPEPVDADRAEATYKHGLLTIQLPKLKKEKTQKVEITGSE